MQIGRHQPYNIDNLILNAIACLELETKVEVSETILKNFKIWLKTFTNHMELGLFCAGFVKPVQYWKIPQS